MAQNEFSEMLSLGDMWNDDILVIPRSSAREESLSMMDKRKDPFITSQNLFHSGEDTSTVLNQGFESSGMNFNIISEQWNTESLDLSGLKKSPWHESDSGMSTMSEANSALGSSDVFVNDVDTVLPVVEWPEEEENDLAAYLLGTDLSVLENELTFEDSNQKQSLSQQLAKPQYMYNTRAKANMDVGQKQVPLALINNYAEPNVDVENSDSECSNNGSTSPNDLNASASKPLHYFENMCDSSVKKPSVKIVKVLKTSAGSECCDDDIVKALDERSKKNAIQAKMNREKKKRYVNSLENDVERLGEENKELTKENAELKENLAGLEEEVKYLKSVLVNASALSGLLRNIGGVSDVKLSASIVGRKRGASDCNDHSYTAAANMAGEAGRTERSAKRARMVRDNLEKAGVCLHVNSGEASLEFCANCSSLAKRSQNQSRKS